MSLSSGDSTGIYAFILLFEDIILADWPLTYHRLTDKPKCDKTN